MPSRTRRTTSASSRRRPRAALPSSSVRRQANHSSPATVSLLRRVTSKTDGQPAKPWPKSRCCAQIMSCLPMTRSNLCCLCCRPRMAGGARAERSPAGTKFWLTSREMQFAIFWPCAFLAHLTDILDRNMRPTPSISSCGGCMRAWCTAWTAVRRPCIACVIGLSPHALSSLVSPGRHWEHHGGSALDRSLGAHLYRLLRCARRAPLPPRPSPRDQSKLHAG